MKPLASNSQYRLHQQKVGGEIVNLAYSMVGTSDINYVVCLHGINRNRRDFDYLASKLSHTHTVICIDIFGRGTSDWLKDKTKYNYAVYYHSVRNLLNDLGVAQVKLVGTSMGGIIGMYLASSQPQLVSKLVLNDIGPFVTLDALNTLVYYVNSYPKFNFKTEAESYLKKFLSPLKLSEDKLPHMIEHTLLLREDGCYHLHYDPAIGSKLAYDVQNMGGGMDLWHIWKKINQPMLILRGEESEVLRRDTLQRMISDRNNVKCIEYQGIGHCPSLTEDEQISDIAQWLNTT